MKINVRRFPTPWALADYINTEREQRELKVEAIIMDGDTFLLFYWE